MVMSGKLLFTLSLVCLLSSCNSEIDNLDQPQVPAENRAVFESTSDFMKTFENLIYYNKSELKEWSKSKNINSLLEECEKNNLEQTQLPQALQSMLNKNAEFQIKDSIIRYDNNNFYLIAVNNTELEEFVIIGGVKSNKLGNSDLTKGYYEMGTDEIDGSHQYEFKLEEGDKYTFKYVHELQTYTINLHIDTGYYLSMRVKLEYRGKKWHEASEMRELEYQISTTVDLVPVLTGASNYPRIPTTTPAQGNVEIPLAVYFISNDTRIKQWNVSIGGYIKHQVIGYPDTQWKDNL